MMGFISMFVATTKLVYPKEKMSSEINMQIPSLPVPVLKFSMKTRSSKRVVPSECTQTLNLPQSVVPIRALYSDVFRCGLGSVSVSNKIHLLRFSTNKGHF